MNKLIIIISGNKSKMSEVINSIAVTYLNASFWTPRFSLNESNYIVDNASSKVVILDSGYIEKPTMQYPVKIYNSDDSLKKISLDMFGLDFLQCYGNENDMNSFTHVYWDDLNNDIRKKYKKDKKKTKNHPVAAKDFLEILKNDFILKFDKNALTRSMYSTINKEKYELCIIEDAKTANEITIGTEGGAKAIKIAVGNKEEDFNDLPLGEYDLVIDVFNSKKDPSLIKLQEIVKPKVTQWLRDYKII